MENGREESKESIKTITQLEAIFSANNYNGCSKEAFKIEEGSIPIMVSAPHAVNHYRNGKIKLADRYTGGIARYLHEATNCHLIFNCKFNRDNKHVLKS